MTLVAVYETFNFYYSLLSLARVGKYKLRAEVAKYKLGQGPSNTNWGLDQRPGSTNTHIEKTTALLMF